MEEDRIAASPPALPISATNASPRESSKSVITTFAPSRASVAARDVLVGGGRAARLRYRCADHWPDFDEPELHPE